MIKRISTLGILAVVLALAVPADAVTPRTYVTYDCTHLPANRLSARRRTELEKLCKKLGRRGPAARRESR